MSVLVQDLNFAYCTRAVLSGISFEADAGLLAVLGPNGVGKTTLFRCILGLLRHYTGQISVDGKNAAKIPPRHLADLIAYIPQIHGQTFGYSVGEMVLMGTSHAASPLSMPQKKDLDIAHGALERLGIAHLTDKNFTHLSGGEQQLTLIARALAQQTHILLMDEPTASLDYGNQTHVLQMVRSLADEGYTVIMSTHNPQHALWYADRALALSGGCVAAWGEPKKVMDAALIQQLYGIKVQFIATDSGPLISPSVGEY